MSEQIGNNQNNTGDTASTGWDALAEMAPAPKNQESMPPTPTSEPVSAPVEPDYAAQAEADRNETVVNTNPQITSPSNLQTTEQRELLAQRGRRYSEIMRNQAKRRKEFRLKVMQEMFDGMTAEEVSKIENNLRKTVHAALEENRSQSGNDVADEPRRETEISAALDEMSDMELLDLAAGFIDLAFPNAGV